MSTASDPFPITPTVHSPGPDHVLPRPCAAVSRGRWPRRGGPAPALAALLLAVVAACSTSAASPSPSSPVTITDDEGTSVTIGAQPARIVSLAPSVTETLFALGEGSRVVGVTASDDYPPQVKSLPQVATFTGVEAEKVVAARPDLVIGWKGITSAADIARLRSLGLTVMVLYAQTVDRVLADIALVGHATGADGAAGSLVSSLRSRIDGISAAAAAAPTHPRVFYELDATKAIYGLAPDDFTTDLIRHAGGDPITSGTPGVYTISIERLVSADPQVILLGDAAYGTTVSAVRSRPGWGGITAVRSGAVRPIDDIIVTRPGPRIADGLAALAEAIHPGLVLPPGSTSTPGSSGSGAGAEPGASAATSSTAP